MVIWHKFKKKTRQEEILERNIKNASKKVYLIGYWSWGGNSRYSDYEIYPHPSEWVDLNWDEEQRLEVYRTLKSGKKCRFYMGWSSCRICGAHVGTGEKLKGKFLYPEGLEHYIEKHNVRLPTTIITDLLHPSILDPKEKDIIKPYSFMGSAGTKHNTYEILNDVEEDENWWVDNFGYPEKRKPPKPESKISKGWDDIIDSAIKQEIDITFD
jgi:hypothetical protein